MSLFQTETLVMCNCTYICAPTGRPISVVEHSLHLKLSSTDDAEDDRMKVVEDLALLAQTHLQSLSFANLRFLDSVEPSFTPLSLSISLQDRDLDTNQRFILCELTARACIANLRTLQTHNKAIQTRQQRLIEWIEDNAYHTARRVHEVWLRKQFDDTVAELKRLPRIIAETTSQFASIFEVMRKRTKQMVLAFTNHPPAALTFLNPLPVVPRVPQPSFQDLQLVESDPRNAFTLYLCNHLAGAGHTLDSLAASPKGFVHLTHEEISHAGMTIQNVIVDIWMRQVMDVNGFSVRVHRSEPGAWDPI